MRTAILHTIRHHPQVQGSLRFTALELAYKFNAQGCARVAYQWLAKRTGFCVQTIIRHIKALVRLGLIAKTVQRVTKYQCERNLYTLAGPLADLHKRATLTGSERQQQRGRNLTREDIQTLEKGLRMLTPGSVAYQSTLDALHRLRR